MQQNLCLYCDRERQLLLTSETKDIAINSLAYRNAINNALKTVKVENVLVLTVAVSRTDASIVVFFFFLFLHLVYAV